MSNGPDTHEWRLEQLEAWRERMERIIWRAAIAIFGNMVGIVLLLIMEIVRTWGGK